MAEPSTTTFIVTGGVAAILGPILGPYTLIAFGAVAGSMLAMGRTPTATRSEAVKFVAVGVFIALAITGIFAWALEKYFSIPSNIALVPVAAIIGAGRNGLLSVIDSLLAAVASAGSKRIDK